MSFFVVISLASVVWVSEASNVTLPLVLEVSAENLCSTSPPAVSISNTKDIFEQANQFLNNKYGTSCSCKDNAEGWKKIAHLNMANATERCPSNWTLLSTPVRGCRRSNPRPSCDSVIFGSEGFPYNKVCGRVLGYQGGSTDAFELVNSRVATLDQPYVDGVSLTHGSPGSRQHIWTFASAVYETDPSFSSPHNCECTNTNHQWSYQVPSFIQNNYFCDTGNPGPGIHDFSRVFSEDPLWDGQGCGPTNACCQLNTPPWFCTVLPKATSDYLEVRICNSQNAADESVVVSKFEIYVRLN